MAKFAIHKDNSYEYAIIMGSAHIRHFFVNYNFMAISIGMSLFKVACPNTKIESAKCFSDDYCLLDRKHAKFIDWEWNNVILNIIEDTLENKAKRKWNNYPSIQEVAKSFYENKAFFEDWLNDKCWNNIKDVIKYGTVEQRKEYWEFMTTLNERIKIAQNYFKKTEEIILERL